MSSKLSPLATLIAHPQDIRDRKSPVYGVCVHTTGSGVPTRAKRLGCEPIVIAIDVYSAPGAHFPHYVIDGQGTIVQIAGEEELAPHCGIAPTERSQYKSGAWTRVLSPYALMRWRNRWPGVQSPLGLFPTASANESYLGVELVPSLFLTANKTLFTNAQYASLRALLDDVQKRCHLDLVGSRLVGHEDVNPLTRCDRNGGWDPGFSRERPNFIWALV